MNLSLILKYIIKIFEHISEATTRRWKIGFAKVFYMSMRQKKEQNKKIKRKYRVHYFRALPSFRADMANATTNSLCSTGNVRKYSERHINGNFLVVLPLMSRD